MATVDLDRSPPDAECPFCAIIADRAPAREVLRTDRIIAFLPDVPAVRGHVLVVPRKHVDYIWRLDRAIGCDLADAVRLVSSAVVESTRADGLNVIQSNGEAAGQSVFHLHVHIVPRHRGDRMPELWPPDAIWSPEVLDKVAAELAASLM
ncbi:MULTISPECIES: HIT family protein [Dietzia]|uniref:HIT family protein n=1 Tax=Dietzia TaxID=37914 RepID=UPI003556CCD2